MIARLGEALSRVFQKTAPDPFVIAILLTILTAALALTVGDLPVADVAEPTFAQRAAALLAVWRADDGLWAFLAFGMQMCLILVTGHALASARPVRRAIDALAALPRSTASAAGVVSIAACVAGLINWGLGLIVGALLAREVGRALAARGVRAHYPLICAAGYTTMLVWHGGLSGSAPLSMTTAEGAAKVLPAATLQTLGEGGVPLTHTIFSPLNLFVSGGLVLGVPLVMMLLAPRHAGEAQPFNAFVSNDDVPTSRPENDGAAHPALPDRLDRSPTIAWLLALPLLLAMAQYIDVAGVSRLGLNEINATMLALGLVLHGSPRAYMRAAVEGARGCAGIIVQFPLYAGIMAMMAAAGLVTMLAEGFTSIGDANTIPILSLLSAGVVNLFVPSGGGQWGIQGPIALATGLDAGIPAGEMIMAVAYGDQLTNMLQPFWALPLLGITGVRARDIVGYTTVAMLAAAAWIVLGLLIF